MKLLLTLALICVQFLDAYSQVRTKTEKALKQNLEIDTAISPDYFLVKITVGESVEYIREGKKEKRVFIDLDSASAALKENLVKLGFSQDLKKTSIAGKTKHYHAGYYGRIFYEVTYEFEVSDKDSVNYLFEKLHKENVASLIITPKLKDSTIARAKEVLAISGLVAMEKFAKAIADTMGQKIITLSNLEFNFSDKNYNYYKYLYAESKDFLVDINDIEYRLEVSYTYFFENK